MKPVTSIFNFSFLEHGLKMLEGFLELREKQCCVVKVGDTGVLGIPADVDDLASTLKQGRWKHGNRHVGFDDAWRRQLFDRNNKNCKK